MFGDSPYSNEVYVKVTPGVPAAPSSLNGVKTGRTQMTIWWTNLPNTEDTFDIFRSINGGGYLKVHSNPKDKTAYTDDLSTVSLVDLATVAYKVIAVNEAGNSAPAVATFALAHGGPDLTKNLNTMAQDVTHHSPL